PPTPLYTLSLHDALPISSSSTTSSSSSSTTSSSTTSTTASSSSSTTSGVARDLVVGSIQEPRWLDQTRISDSIEILVGAQIYEPDRKSTRLNSSHVSISY